MQKDKEKAREYAVNYYNRNKEKVLVRVRGTYESHKQQTLAHYGDRCACCGETEPLFLTIDHINNDGHLQRKQAGRSAHNNIYGWLVRSGFPSGFQVLCMNCNQGKHRNGGICPHREGSTITESAAHAVKQVG